MAQINSVLITFNSPTIPYLLNVFLLSTRAYNYGVFKVTTNNVADELPVACVNATAYKGSFLINTNIIEPIYTIFLAHNLVRRLKVRAISHVTCVMETRRQIDVNLSLRFSYDMVHGWVNEKKVVSR